jgi:hypothetical protein
VGPTGSQCGTCSALPRPPSCRGTPPPHPRCAARRTFKSFHDITTQNPATETLYNADGSLQTIKVTALARTFAPAIAGDPGRCVCPLAALCNLLQPL